MEATAPRIEIRNCRPEDFERLYEIDRICFEPGISYSKRELFSYLKLRRSVCRIAELEGKIAGFVLGRIDSDRWAHVITLDVLPEARRKRIATALMAVLHDVFLRNGVQLVVLEVDTQNEVARNFYLRLGYEPVETLRGYYLGRRDAHRMVRFLSG